MSVAIVEARPATPVNVADFLAKQNKAVARGGAKKENHPSLSGHESLADAAVASKRALTDAKAASGLLDERVIETVQPTYRTNARCGNSSVVLPGADTGGVIVVFSDRFTDIDFEKCAELQAADPEFSDHFRQQRKISLRDDAASDDAVIADLLAVLGPEKFGTIFETKLAITCAKGMAAMQFELPESARALVVQYRPSVRCR